MPLNSLVCKHVRERVSGLVVQISAVGMDKERASVTNHRLYGR